MTSTKEYWRQKKRSQKLAYENAERFAVSKRSVFQRKLYEDAGALSMAGLALVMGLLFAFSQPSFEMFTLLAFFALLAAAQFLFTFWEVFFPPRKNIEKLAASTSDERAEFGPTIVEGAPQTTVQKGAVKMKNFPWAQIIFFVSGLALILITALNSDYVDEPRALMTGGGFLLLTGLALRALSIWQSKKPPT